MNKMTLTTNRGKIFDYFLNLYINFILWFKMINDEDTAIEETSKQIIMIKKTFNL